MLITPAYAQSNPLSALFGGDSGGMVTSLLPLILIVVIMYFLVLRPQQQKVKQHQAMVKAVRRGDTVYSISREFQISVAQLKSWNGLNSHHQIKAGQRLVMYVEPGRQQG